MDTVPNIHLSQQILGGNDVFNVLLFMSITVLPLITLWFDEV